MAVENHSKNNSLAFDVSGVWKLGVGGMKGAFIGLDGAGNTPYSSKDTVVTPEEVKAGVEARLSALQEDHITSVRQQILHKNIDAKDLSKNISSSDLNVSPKSVEQYEESVVDAHKKAAPKQQLTANEVNELLPILRDGYLTSSPAVKEQATTKIHDLGENPANAVKFIREEFGLNVAPEDAKKLVEAMRAGATSQTLAEAIGKQDNAQTAHSMQREKGREDQEKKETKEGLKANKEEQKENWLMAFINAVLSMFGIKTGSDVAQNVETSVRASSAGKSTPPPVEQAVEKVRNVTGEDRFGGLSAAALNEALKVGQAAKDMGAKPSEQDTTRIDNAGGLSVGGLKVASAGRY